MRARLASRAADYGVTIEGRVTIDMKKVVARKNVVSNTAQKNILACVDAGLHRYARSCAFYFTKRNEVDGNRVTADKIFINVGGRALVPPIAGVDPIDFLTNETIVNVESVPPHLLILGGSYMGLEFAQMFRRFGSKVTVVEAAPRLLPREDDDMSDAIRDILEREGITIHLATKCTGLAGRGAAIVAQLDAPTGTVAGRAKFDQNLPS